MNDETLKLEIIKDLLQDLSDEELKLLEDEIRDEFEERRKVIEK